MPKFKPYDDNPTAMVVINYQDQLPPGDFEKVDQFPTAGAMQADIESAPVDSGAGICQYKQQ